MSNPPVDGAGRPTLIVTCRHRCALPVSARGSKKSAPPSIDPRRAERSHGALRGAGSTVRMKRRPRRRPRRLRQTTVREGSNVNGKHLVGLAIGTGVLLVVAGAPAGRDPAAVAETPGPSSRAGQAIYRTHCAACHGASGRGDGEASGLLFPKPRDLTSGRFRLRSTPSGSLPTDEDLVRTVTRHQDARPFGTAAGLGRVSDQRSIAASTPGPNIWFR